MAFIIGVLLGGILPTMRKASGGYSFISLFFANHLHIFPALATWNLSYIVDFENAVPDTRIRKFEPYWNFTQWGLNSQ